MRLLIATDTYYPHINGASYFTQRLAHTMQQRGNEVLVVAPSRSVREERSQHEEVSIHGLPSLPAVVHTSFRIALPPPFLLASLRHLITTFKPEVIHVQGHFFIGRSAIRVGKERGIPLIGTNHFLPENLLPYLPLPARGKEKAEQWLWHDFKRIFAGLDIITTPTQTAARLIEQSGFAHPVEVVSCGIDQSIFHPQHDGRYLKTRYQLPNRPLLLYVGRLDREKHLEVILQALARIAPSHRPHFVVAGRGAEEKTLKRLTHQLGLEVSTTFLGFVPDSDLPALYCLADCFVIAGTAELQSLVTMEALASGLPVIAARALALPELVQPGKNGYLFESGNAQQLADAIEESMTNEPRRRRMAQHSLKLIHSHNLNHVIRQYEALYERVLALRLNLRK